jgi:hypothetical protein
MPRATTKTELIASANNQWDKLWSMIESIPESKRKVDFNFKEDPKLKEAHWKRDKNLRDVLTHLHEWHLLLLNWVSANKGGALQPFLPEPYNWKSYGDMNIELWKKHQSTAYENAVKMLHNSHVEVMALVETFTDEELFTKKYYSWTGTSNVGSYFISVTSSHYDWAMKKLKLYIKNL